MKECKTVSPPSPFNIVLGKARIARLFFFFFFFFFFTLKQRFQWRVGRVGMTLFFLEEIGVVWRILKNDGSVSRVLFEAVAMERLSAVHLIVR